MRFKIHNIAKEFWTCNCGKTYLSTTHGLIDHPPTHIQEQFPAVLTYKYGIDDNTVISLMNSRTCGNSAHALKNTMSEMHGEGWIRKVYYTLQLVRNTKWFFPQLTKELSFNECPAQRRQLSKHHNGLWPLMLRMFDQGLRTQKGKSHMCLWRSSRLIQQKKSWKSWQEKQEEQLLGSPKYTTSSFLQFVLITSSESNDGLQDLANGLMKRYADVHPRLLYTDRDWLLR